MSVGHENGLASTHTSQIVTEARLQFARTDNTGFGHVVTITTLGIRRKECYITR